MLLVRSSKWIDIKRERPLEVKGFGRVRQKWESIEGVQIQRKRKEKER